MEPCVIDANGVGDYDATAAIEAENFWERRGLATKLDLTTRAASGFGVAMEAGAELVYPRVAGLPAGVGGGLRVTVLAANGGASATVLEVNVSHGSSRWAAARCVIQPTGSPAVFEQTQCIPVPAAKAITVDELAVATRTVVLSTHGPAGHELLAIDRFWLGV